MKYCRLFNSLQSESLTTNVSLSYNNFKLIGFF